MEGQAEQAPFSWALARNQGPSHRVTGAPCQDAVLVNHVSGPKGTSWAVAALADGAGSAKFAEDGSEYAVSAFVAFMMEALAEFEITSNSDLEDLLSRGAELVSSTLNKVSHANARDASAYATTFLACVSSKERTGFLQVGDGAILLRQYPEDWQLAVQPFEGVYANETLSITNDTACDRAQLHVQGNAPDGVVLISDGLEDLLVHPATGDIKVRLPEQIYQSLKTQPLAGENKKLSGSILELLESDVITQRSDDDTSLIALRLVATETCAETL